jgi:hypothetical protein
MTSSSALAQYRATIIVCGKLTWSCMSRWLEDPVTARENSRYCPHLKELVLESE